MRIAVRSVTILLALAALGLAIFLVPPHLQIQRIEPPLPSEAELRALLTAPAGPVAVHFLNTSSQEARGRLLGHTVFLIEWANGNLFMIDAGMDRVAAAEFAELMKTAFGAGDAEIHGSVAELLGDAVGRVAGVGLTHLHIDHSQGLLPFCAARGEGAALYQTSWQAEQHNFNTEEGAAIAAQSCLAPGELEGERILTSDAFPGLGIVALGGHTPGSTLFAAAVRGRLWLFAGDTTNTKADLLANRGKGFLYSMILVPENTGRTEELRRWLTRLDAEEYVSVVVSHDLADVEASGMARFSP